MSTPQLYIDPGIQVPKYCNVAAFAVLIFDYCITLEAESRWVWHRKWTFVRFIFTISRYLTFFAIGMTFVAALRTQYYPGESCARYVKASNVLHILCIIAAEGLLVMRIYAAWPSKHLLTFLLVFSAVCFITYYIIADTPLVPNSMNRTPIQIPTPNDCLFLPGRNSIYEYTALLLYESVLLCLMLFIRFRRYKQAIGSLQETFFRDTTRYMIYIIILTSINIILTVAPLITWASVPDSPQIVVHSVLASRILFNLRASEGHSQTGPTVEELTEIRFQGVQRSTLTFEV